MLTIGDHIKEAIDYMDKGKLENALLSTCIAIDLTAQKITGKQSSRTDYKKFISDYMWLITYIGLPGIMAGGIKIPFKHHDIKPDVDGYCGIEDIVYHVIRCSLVHSTGLDSKIVWCENTIIGNDRNGNLEISNKFIWGLIGAIIFCPKNKEEKIPETYWIRINDFKWFIQELWGRIDLIKRIITINSN